MLGEDQILTDEMLTTYQQKFQHLERAADTVRESLRGAILDGNISPGARLREEDLARKFGVSRTPVREALQQLRSDGLVDLSHHQGATVAKLSAEDILAIYLVRESLEGLAARLAALHATAEDGERLRAIIDEMESQLDERDNTKTLSDLNLRFHAEIRRIANNRYLDRFLSQVEHAVHRFGQTTYAYAGRRNQSVSEHRAILEAIMSGDSKQAEALAISHMREARELRFRMLLEGIG